MATKAKRRKHRCCIVCGWDSLQRFTQTQEDPLLRGWRIGPEERPSTLALSGIWYAAAAKARKSPGSKQQVFNEILESWIRNVYDCDCIKDGLRRLLLDQKDRRTSELLARQPETRPWSFILREAWETMRAPWDIAPEHSVVQDWKKSLADRQALTRGHGWSFHNDPRGDFARVRRIVEDTQKRVEAFRAATTVKEILVATDPRG